MRFPLALTHNILRRCRRSALTGPNGDIVARYTYDAWGKILSITDADGNDVSTNATHIANINPLRYRSYVYDSESGFYYLTSRYYDPTVGRFINADNQLVTDSGMVGYNPYAYCGNNPVIYVDETGHSFTLAICTITLVTTFFACISPAGLARTDAVLNEPNAYNVGNWLTLGAFDTVKGTFMPEEPLSLQHWIDSAGTASLILPGVNYLDDLAHIKSSDPLKNALNELELSGLRPGQTEISRSKVMSLVNNFDSTKAQSSIYAGDSVRYLVDGHHTTVASTILGKGTCMNMGMATNQLPSITNLHWSKKWYEFGKRAIRIVD